MNTVRIQIDLVLKDILKLHTELENNPLCPAVKGIRDMNLLESAVNAPFQTFGGQDLYPTIFEKAAQLLYGLNKNHGFIDGNKRIAIHAMLVYLIINDIEIEYTQEDIVSLSIAVADDKANPADIVEWIENRVIKKPLDDLNRSFL